MFTCKVRTWWIDNPSWPNGLEPGATPWDKCRPRATFETEQEARKWCDEYNGTHNPGRYSKKAEYSS